PLGDHLAALLNPALVGRGFEEAASAFLPEQLDDHEAARLGLGQEPAMQREKPRRRLPERENFTTGSGATAEVLQELLEKGDPNFHASQVWTPHRPERPEKSEGGLRFELVSEYKPEGDQPHAIEELVAGIEAAERDQVQLGVTGSGKTFTMAQVISRTQRPALVLAPNKTLAAQLYGEFKSFFPHNAVEYFVSYYDYYQPEAYVPRTDTFIEKDAAINEHIDKLRLSATRSLFERRDCLIVASVSCIYGLGSPEAYYGMMLFLEKGQKIKRADITRKLVEILYERTEGDFRRGT